jgi:hypothetical protein
VKIQNKFPRGSVYTLYFLLFHYQRFVELEKTS